MTKKEVNIGKGKNTSKSIPENITVNSCVVSFYFACYLVETSIDAKGWKYYYSAIQYVSIRTVTLVKCSDMSRNTNYVIDLNITLSLLKSNSHLVAQEWPVVTVLGKC